MYSTMGKLDNPLKYAGEWNQLLFIDYDILSVDVELPSWPFDEGRRGQGYDPTKVVNENFQRFNRIENGATIT